MNTELPCSDPVCRTVAGVPSSLLPFRLRVVVQPAGVPLGEDAFTADFHPNLVGAVVVKGRQDEPLVLTRHLAATWQVPDARLWDDALTSLGVEPFDMQRFALPHTPAMPTIRDVPATRDVPGRRTEAYSVTGMGWPGVAHMFRLEQVLGLRLPLGALVMVTDANSFVTLPLESNATLTAASALWDLNEALRRQRPEPLPPRLLWVRGWAVHDLGAGVVDGQFTVELPGELRAALAQLN